jgi:hypothetical protein
MKPLCLLTSLLWLFVCSARAQEPPANTIAYNGPQPNTETVASPRHKTRPKKTPSWKKEHDRVDGHIDHTLLKQMAQTTDTIIALFKDSCLSIGSFLPSWYGEFVSDKRSLSSRTNFGLECQFQGNARIGVVANNIDVLYRDTLYVNGKIFQTLKVPPVRKNGFSCFEYLVSDPDPLAGVAPATAGDTANAQSLHRRLWLITADSAKLPYIAVTRREYLTTAIQEVKLEKEKLTADIKVRTPVKSPEAQKAEKEHEIEDIRQTYSGSESEMRVRRFLNTYKSDEDYLKDGIEKGTADINATLHLMDSLLTHLSAAELKKPATVSVPAVNFEAFEDGLPNRRILVRTDSTYFNPALTAEKPQCFLVCWTYDPSEPMAADIDGQLNEKLNFKKLQDLLTK